MTSDNSVNTERTQRTIRPQQFVREKELIREKEALQPEMQQQQQQQQAGGKACPFCGAINDPEAMFCAQCGQPISKATCPYCSSEKILMPTFVRCAIIISARMSVPIAEQS